MELSVNHELAECYRSQIRSDGVTEMNARNIILIWPYVDVAKHFMPMAFGYLKSNTDSSRFDISVINCTLLRMRSEDPRLKEELQKRKPDVVGVSSRSMFFDEALALFRLVKSVCPGTVTVYGGPHATCYAQKVMANSEIDFVFRGEAELAFQPFLEELEKTAPDFSSVPGLTYRETGGRVRSNEIAYIESLDSIRIPDYDLMNIQEYARQGLLYETPASVKLSAPVLLTRGCPYRCAYCSASIINGPVIRKHSIEYAVDWVEHLYCEKGVRWINVIDDNFTFDVCYAKDFCEAIIRRGFKDLRFGSPNGIRMERGSKELWTLMKKAGWERLLIAPESGSKRVLKLMRKKLDIELIPGIVDDIRSTGLEVTGLFMVGYPNETIEDIKETVALIRKTRFDFLSIGKFNPLPGTPVYDELVASGEIPDTFLPGSNGDVELRAYTPKDLAQFNFAWLILRENILLKLRHPGPLLRTKDPFGKLWKLARSTLAFMRK